MAIIISILMSLGFISNPSNTQNDIQTNNTKDHSYTDYSQRGNWDWTEGH